MQICHCVLGTLSPDSCKNCNNNNERIIYNENPNSYIPPGIEPISTDKIDLTKILWYQIKTLDDIKSKIENLTIKELKELMEYMKKYEALVK